MLPYTVGSSESSELSDPYGVWPCESLPNVGRSNCVWSSWVDCSGTVGSGGMLGMEGASGAGAACGVAGAAGVYWAAGAAGIAGAAY